MRTEQTDNKGRAARAQMDKEAAERAEINAKREQEEASHKGLAAAGVPWHATE